MTRSTVWKKQPHLARFEPLSLRQLRLRGSCQGLHTLSSDLLFLIQPGFLNNNDDFRDMEDSRNPETVAPGLCRMSAMPGSPPPDPVEKLHSQADSFLTAARLLRRGWMEEGKKAGQQFDRSAYQSNPSRSDGNPDPRRAEICLKDPWSRRVGVKNVRKTAEDGETGPGKTRDEVKPTAEVKRTAEAAFSSSRETERQKDIISIWRSGCRIRCRQPRRFKAPMLPVIAEM